MGILGRSREEEEEARANLLMQAGFEADCSHAVQTQLSPAQLVNRTTHSYCWDVLIILLGQALRMGVSEASRGVKDKPL